MMRVMFRLLLGALLAIGAPALAQGDVRPDGAERFTTPPDRASDQNPAFAPDGTRLVFTRFEAGYNVGPSALLLLDPARGTVSRLAAAPESDNVNLPGSIWDAETDRIVFSSDREDIDEIWTLEADGGGLTRVTYHEAAGYFIEPSFAPGAGWIVFEANDGEQGRIWKVRADGSGLTQLTDGPDDRQPNWSPDGARILFQRRAPGTDAWDIYTMDADGDGIRQVTDTGSATDASWSPDGQWIVYSSDDGLPTASIFVIPALGGAAIRVTHDDAQYDGAPSWSPDGRWIAFESHPGDDDTPSALWRIAAPRLSRPAEGGGLAAVDDFLYQLQGLDLAAVGATAYDLLVIDYAANDDDGSAYTAEAIAALRHSPGGEKIVLAYMSIGEAEDYRFYWDDAWFDDPPAWLDAENPNWEGNYKVRYWDPAWQAIIFDYTDRLLDAGFDGAYLDIIDGCWYYEAQGRRSAAAEMVEFVAAIAAYARARDPDFYIFPQNAAELVADFPEYLDVIDGIGQEDVYYGYDGDDKPTPPEVSAELEGYLDRFRAAGKLVLTIDYATAPAHIEDAYTRARARGYVPFVTVRDLDELIINPGYEPD